MNTHADKTQDNKSQSVANEVTQKQTSGESTFQFMDNRPEAIVQRKQQEMANNSPQTKKAIQLQVMANNHSSQTIQSQAGLEEDEILQKKSQPIQKKENKRRLPDNLKFGIENLSGYSMDDVKVHYNSGKTAQMQALAYAQGADIHIGSEQEKHLPHEAWHVVQQKQGRVQTTAQLKKNVPVNDDVALEKEADVMGAKAVQIHHIEKSVFDQSKHEQAPPNQTIQRVLNVNNVPVSLSLIRSHRKGFIEYCTPALAKKGIVSITPKQWDHIFAQMELIVQNENVYNFNVTSELIALIYPNNSADTVMAGLIPNYSLPVNIENKQEMQERGESSVGRLGDEDSIYEREGPSDPEYLTRIKKNKSGQTSLKLGWGSAAHVVQIEGSYFLKKLTIGGSTYAPDKMDIQNTWKGIYNDESDGIEISFPVSAEGGAVNLSEVITFGVSTCSFSVICDVPLKNIIIMHINNKQKMPFGEIYEKSPAFQKKMTRMFVSMIDEKEEIDKVLTAAKKAGIKTMNVLSRPYDIRDADRIHLFTHHKMGVKLGEVPEIFGEQGDAESVFKAVINKVFKRVTDEINAKSPYFGSLSEENVQSIYKTMHAELQNMDVESIELRLQLLDWRIRLKKKGNIKESLERRTIFGARAAFKEIREPEVVEIKEMISEIVNRRIKKRI